ncbi:MAG TPA: hypothetical protein VN408_30090 [Actinoplanes sp.]|nr:hypothetical protein [Actinoplanes sp.]
MVMVGRTVLRSLPVLFALFLALFSAPGGSSGPAVPSTHAASGGFTAPAAFVDVSGPEAEPAGVAGDRAELGGRTAAASPAIATTDAAAHRPTVTRARAALAAPALTSQSVAGVAGSRAPPATV